MSGETLYVAGTPPSALAGALAARGASVRPIRWDAELLAPTAVPAPGAPGGPALHLESLDAAAALKGRWLLFPADGGFPAAAATYARYYDMRLGAFAPFPDDIAEPSCVALPCLGATLLGATLFEPDADGGWTAAADRLSRPPAPRRIRLWRGGGLTDPLGAAFRELGVDVAPFAAAENAENEGGDWLLADEADFFDGESPAAAIAAARRSGWRIAFLCRGEGLEPQAADLAARVRAALEMAEADALLATSAAAVDRLLAFYFRFLPRLVNVAWKTAACAPPPAAAVGGPAWIDYARAVAVALIDRSPPISPPPSAAAPAADGGERRPLLSICFTTYNRAAWLAVSLRRALEQTAPYGDQVEVVVCDNASPDDTPAVVARHIGAPQLRAYRNPVNVGMLGNLGVTARHGRGRFIWVLGDDDLLVEGVVEDVLEGLIRHPDVHMAYLNYAVADGEAPGSLADEERLIRTATPVADGGANRRVAKLKDAAVIHNNLFTAIYTCVFRRDHAVVAYGQNVSARPFSTLASSAPSAAYAARSLMDLPAYWVGRPGLVVNANVSWKEHAALWLLERMPELCDLAERMGADPVRLDACRADLCRAAAINIQRIYRSASEELRGSFLLARLLERCKHLDDFRRYQVPLLLDIHRQALRAGKITGAPSPKDLLDRFGLGNG